MAKYPDYFACPRCNALYTTVNRAWACANKDDAHAVWENQQ